MTTINDGGPAFPTNGPDHGAYGSGLSLRDYFAAQAMQAVGPPTSYVGSQETRESLEYWARRCWTMADAMLKAREQ